MDLFDMLKQNSVGEAHGVCVTVTPEIASEMLWFLATVVVSGDMPGSLAKRITRELIRGYGATEEASLRFGENSDAEYTPSRLISRYAVWCYLLTEMELATADEMKQTRMALLLAGDAIGIDVARASVEELNRIGVQMKHGPSRN